MNLLDILKSMLFLCGRHDIIYWELILGILIIFWIADSYIAINTLII
jgi:hypothetical protein